MDKRIYQSDFWIELQNCIIHDFFKYGTDFPAWISKNVFDFEIVNRGFISIRESRNYISRFDWNRSPWIQ